MGDECHNRNKAATSLFYKEISKKVLLTNFSNEKKLKVLEYISGNDHYFLNLSMPYCKLATIAGNNIKYSSIVSIMSRNGYESLNMTYSVSLSLHLYYMSLQLLIVFYACIGFEKRCFVLFEGIITIIKRGYGTKSIG